MGYGSYRECLYNSIIPGAALNTFTAEAQLNTASVMKPQAHIPLDFWAPYGNPAGAIGRGLHIVARGILSTTGSPTFTITVRGGGPGNITLGPILLGSAVFTAGATVTNQVWELEGDVILEQLGAAAASTIRGLGTLDGGGAAAPASVFGGAASPGTVATFDTTIANYINVNAACGTSNVANTIQLLSLIVEAIN
jgi:hypothetical protein